jgi:hypothetical protein
MVSEIEKHFFPQKISQNKNSKAQQRELCCQLAAETGSNFPDLKGNKKLLNL